MKKFNCVIIFKVQFSAIYLLLLVLFKFFPEHAKLKEDTAAVFNLSRRRQREQELYYEMATATAATAAAAARREVEHEGKTIPAINQQLRKLNRTFKYFCIS